MQLGTSHGPGHSHEHAVQFYADDAELFETVATYFSEGLISGQPAVAIVTRDHAAAIERALRAKFIDATEARHIGDLVLLDADETLGSFMIGGMPNQRLFRRNIGVVLDQALRGRENVRTRLFGEMVDVLWKKGQSAAAIQLEILSNELAGEYAFSLLCGYSMGNFYKQPQQFDAAGFAEVCELHTAASGVAEVPPVQTA